jgi:hypothetical protein
MIFVAVNFLITLGHSSGLEALLAKTQNQAAD